MKGGAVGARIMVINDTQEILEIFDDLLTEEGFEVVLYSYAIQDLDEVERVKPDLIILDYIFGTEKLGWQLLQKVKMRRSTSAIPVIVCTAATRDVMDIEGYLAAKNVLLVPKPFDIDELLNAVRQALEGRGKTASTIDNEAEDAALDRPGEPDERERDKQKKRWQLVLPNRPAECP
jgi:DNA-binding response OmpR family regulator